MAIKFLNTATAATQAVGDNSTKIATTAYADAAAAAIPIGNYLPLAGGTLTGALTGTSATFTGNVGIGTTSPDAKLHVVSSDETVFRIERNSGSGFTVLDIKDGVGTSGNSAIRFSDTAASGRGELNYEHADDSLRINTAGSESMRILANGNVGIGTTSPATTLHIQNGSSGQTYTNLSGALIDVNGTSNSYSALRVGSSTGNNHLVVTNAGNVGIGTTSPQAKLHIATSESATTSESIYLENTGSGGNEGVSIKFNPMFGAESMIASNREGADSGKTNLTFHNSLVNDESPIERMRIDSAGNVGIGTTSPSEKLDVSGTIKTANTTGYGTVVFGSNNNQRYIRGNTAELQVGNALNNFRFLSTAGNYIDSDSANGTTAFRINARTNHTSGNLFEVSNAGVNKVAVDFAGNVGIGTTSPVAKLHTVGEIVGGTTGFSSGMIGFTGLGSYNSSAAVENIDALYLRKGGANGSSTSIALASAGGNNYFVGSRIKFIRTGSNSKGHLAFETKGDTSINTTVERMRIEDGGNVGIGTTSPNTKLDVISGTNNGIRISATDTTSNWRDIDIRSYVSQAQANALPDGSAIYTTNPASQTEPAFSKYGGTVIQGRDGGNSSFAIRLGNGGGYATRMFMGATGETTFSNTVQASGYKSSDGTAGITGTMSFVDKDSVTRTITYKNGLVVGVTP